MHVCKEEGVFMKRLSYKSRRLSIKNKIFSEDMRYLQKKISGKSVYKSLDELYERRPKHRKMWHQY